MPFANSPEDYPGSANTGFGGLPKPSNQGQTIDDILEQAHPGITRKNLKKFPKDFDWGTNKPGHLWDPDN